MKLRSTILGYTEYARKVMLKSYSSDEMRQIIDRREDIIAKYMNEDGISRSDLQIASNNYKKLTDEQALEVLMRIESVSVSATMGAVYSGHFFVPSAYDDIIVDADDVFAVGYTSDSHLSDGSNDAILCTVFTNDPFVPVFPMIYVGKTGFLEFKSKKGREGVEALFTAMCRNLTYPVEDIKQLKKQIKQDGLVKGNLDMKFVLKQISDASVSTGVFNTKQMSSHIYPQSALMLDKMGYILNEDIQDIMHMDKMFNRNYWNKQIKKLVQLSSQS